jgi:hypothetical protein
MGVTDGRERKRGTCPKTVRNASYLNIYNTYIQISDLLPTDLTHSKNIYVRIEFLATSPFQQAGCC